MKITAGVITLLAATLLVSEAQADAFIVEWGGPIGGGKMLPDWTEQDMYLESPNGIIVQDSGAFSGSPDNGSTWMQSLAEPMQAPLTITNLSGVPFALHSVDLAEYSTAFAAPRTIPFIGYKSDGSIVTTSFITDGIIDGTGPLADFETFIFNTDFTDLNRVVVDTYLYSMDNLGVRVVPESSSIAMIVLVSGIGLFIRRNFDSSSFLNG